MDGVTHGLGGRADSLAGEVTRLGLNRGSLAHARGAGLSAVTPPPPKSTTQTQMLSEGGQGEKRNTSKTNQQPAIQVQMCPVWGRVGTSGLEKKASAPCSSSLMQLVIPIRQLSCDDKTNGSGC